MILAITPILNVTLRTEDFFDETEICSYMRKDFVLPVLALAGGALGFGLRRWQWASAYNPDSQLFVHGAPATMVLLALILAAALLLFVLGRGGLRPDDFLPACQCPDALHMAVTAAAAFLFLGAGVFGLLEGMDQLALWRSAPDTYLLTYPVALLLCACLSFPAGVAVLLLGKASYRGETAPCSSLLSIFPAAAGLVWLFASHLNHGTDPILMGYGFSLAAAALLMLAHYDLAAFFFGRPHPRRVVFCSLLGVLLALVSLADSPSRFAALLTAAFSLSALAWTRALLRNCFGPPWPKRLLDGRMPLGAQEEDGDQTQTD